MSQKWYGYDPSRFMSFPKLVVIFSLKLVTCSPLAPAAETSRTCWMGRTVVGWGNSAWNKNDNVPCAKTCDNTFFLFGSSTPKSSSGSKMSAGKHVDPKGQGETTCLGDQLPVGIRTAGLNLNWLVFAAGRIRIVCRVRRVLGTG